VICDQISRITGCNIIYDLHSGLKLGQSTSGIFNGILGVLQQNESDLCIYNVNMNYERYNAVKYFHLYKVENTVTFSTMNRFVKHKDGSIYSLLQPECWVILFAVAILIYSIINKKKIPDKTNLWTKFLNHLLFTLSLSEPLLNKTCMSILSIFFIQ